MEMKLLLSLMLIFSSFINYGQVALVSGSGSFNIKSSVYPLNSIVLNVRVDSVYVGMDLANIPATFPPYAYNRTVVAPIPLTDYTLDGVACSTLVQLRAFYNSYMVLSSLNVGSMTITGGGSGEGTATVPTGTIIKGIAVKNVTRPTAPFTDEVISIPVWNVSGTTLTVYLQTATMGIPADDYLVTFVY